MAVYLTPCRCLCRHKTDVQRHFIQISYRPIKRIKNSTSIIIQKYAICLKWEPIIFWFICGGLGVFTPLIITGILMLRREGCEFTKEFFGEGYYFLARSWLLGVTHICYMVRDGLYFTLHSVGNWWLCCCRFCI